MEPRELIAEISSRLIVNRAALKTKFDEINVFTNLILVFLVTLKVIEKNKVGKGAQSLRILFSSSASFDSDVSRLTETDTSLPQVFRKRCQNSLKNQIRGRLGAFRYNQFIRG